LVTGLNGGLLFAFVLFLVSSGWLFYKIVNCIKSSVVILTEIITEQCHLMILLSKTYT